MDLTPTGFDANSTAAEVVKGTDLSGRTAIVTGGSSGIGVETARALAAAGAAVTLAVRDLAAGHEVAEDIAATTGNRRVVAAELDLADLASVDAFTRAWSGPLHILVNNAGVMMTPERYTTPGWELQFATNHLGHFALTVGLHEALAAEPGARVVSVSSSGHGNSPVVFDDLFFDRRPYDPGQAYGQSKTANALFAVELTRRWAAEGITANSLMPGGIWTKLQRHWDPDALAGAKQQAARSGVNKTPEQGAATSVLLATSPELAGVGGRYFEDCHEAQLVPAIVDGIHGVRPYALDPVAAERLWDVSLALLSAARNAAPTSARPAGARSGSGSEPPATDSPTTIVEQFVRSLVRRDYEEAERFLTEGATFVNGTTGTAHGREEIIASLRPVLDAVDALDWPIQQAVGDGETVLVERLDRFRVGDRWAEIPVSGVFTLDSTGLISFWRDYFDAAAGQVALESLWTQTA